MAGKNKRVACKNGWLINLAVLASGAKVEAGKLQTPSGADYIGFKITVGEVLDPASVKRTYEDIESILGKNKVNYETHEESTSSGTFKSYSVST